MGFKKTILFGSAVFLLVQCRGSKIGQRRFVNSPPPESLTCQVLPNFPALDIIVFEGKFYDSEGNIVEGSLPFTFEVTASRNGQSKSIIVSDVAFDTTAVKTVSSPPIVAQLRPTFQAKLIKLGTHFIDVTVREGSDPSITGTCRTSVTLNSIAPNTPAVNLQANGSDSTITIPIGAQVTLSWVAQNSGLCDVWRINADSSRTDLETDVGPVGSRITGIHTNATSALRQVTYHVECESTFGDVEDQVAVRVPPNPVATFLVNGAANNITLASGSNYNVSWSSLYTTWGAEASGLQCQIRKNGDMYSDLLSASFSQSSIIATTRWDMSCNDKIGNTSSKTLTVSVTPPQTAPTCVLTTTKSSYELNEPVPITIVVTGPVTITSLNGINVVPATGATLPFIANQLGTLYSIGVVTGPGGTNTCETNFNVRPLDALYEFGGLYGYGSPNNFPNPLVAVNQNTNFGFSCPSGFTSKKTYGSPSVNGSNKSDYALYFCYRVRAPGDPILYDFGGMYGGYWSGTSYYYDNPATQAASCPTGYTSYRTLGTNDVDYSIDWCLKPHTGTRPEFVFGGMYSNSGGTTYGNPLNGGSAGCPSGFFANTTLGTHDLDAVLKHCFKAQ